MDPIQCFVTEAKSYSVYTRKYSNLDDFCKHITTIQDLNSWMRVNDLRWPDGSEWQEFRRGPFQWPEIIFKTRKISCIDIAAFAYLFCRKQGIPATIAKFAAYIKFSPWKEPMRFNHYLCIYRQSDGWYSFDYSMDTSPLFSIPPIYGPFQSIDTLLNKLSTRHHNGLEFVYKDQKFFRKLESITERYGYMTSKETEDLYKLYKSGLSVGRWDYFDKNVKSFYFKEDETSTKNPSEQHMDSIIDYTMLNVIKRYDNIMQAKQAIIDKLIKFVKDHSNRFITG
jgi:hypothetical protein